MFQCVRYHGDTHKLLLVFLMIFMEVSWKLNEYSVRERNENTFVKMQLRAAVLRALLLSLGNTPMLEDESQRCWSRCCLSHHSECLRNCFNVGLSFVFQGNYLPIFLVRPG